MSAPSKIKFLLLAFVVAFIAGCGDSREDFVITGNNNPVNPPNTGNLVFQFTQAQAVNVPLGTQSLEFVFFDIDGDQVDSSDETYAATVTIEDVPVTAVEVEITARGAGGVPLALVTDGVAVTGGETVTIDLSNATVTPIELSAITVTPDPVALDVDGPVSAQLAVTGTFSNGDVVALDADTDAVLTFNGFDATVATVSPAGQVNVVAAGNTDVDVTADINGSSATLNVPITVGGVNEPTGTLIVRPDSLVFNNQGLLGLLGILNGDTDAFSIFRVYFLPPGETDPEAAIEVTQFSGVSFGNFSPSTVTEDSFAYIYLEGNGLAVGTSPLGPTPAYGSTATMTVTYIDPNSPSNLVYTEDVQITIGNPTLVGVILTNDEQLILPNQTANFPVGLGAVYSNGVVLPTALNGAANANGDAFELSIDANAFVTTDGATLSTTFTEGTATVEVLLNGDTEVPYDSFQVTNTDAVVREVALSPALITVNPVGNYRVTMEFSDGTVQDVTRVWSDLTYNSTDGSLATTGSPLFGPQELGRLLGRDLGEGELTIGPLMQVATFMQTSLGFPPGNEDFEFNNNTSNVIIEAVIVPSLP